MKELKVDSSSTGERADNQNTALDQQPSFQESAITPWNSDLSRQLRQWPRRQFQFGPPLCDGYAPETATPAQASRQIREPRNLAPGRQLSPSSLSPGHKKVMQPSPTLRAQIERELAEVRAAWQRYRSTHDRNAVYFYLEAVFALVRRWERQQCALKNSRAALRLKPRAPKMKPEAFARVIFCTCDPDVADAKTRSKWSRVLRFARNAKPANQRLTDFIKSNGGINACAARFAQIR